jgi:hypothetical protein
LDYEDTQGAYLGKGQLRFENDEALLAATGTAPAARPCSRFISEVAALRRQKRSGRRRAPLRTGRQEQSFAAHVAAQDLGRPRVGLEFNVSSSKPRCRHRQRANSTCTVIVPSFLLAMNEITFRLRGKSSMFLQICSLFRPIKFPVKFCELNRRNGGSVFKQSALRSSTAGTPEENIEFSL